MSATPQFTNELINETSPYLLQHAHNPVHWKPWCQEVFSLATTQNKPILVSIGYAACHWCHVMERESFESQKVADFMNANFINVKVDREERPDVDNLYMEALQAMTGSGGWPLHIFLLPNGKPFYGGTYFPPIPIHNRPSWMEVLVSIKDIFNNDPEKIIQQAATLSNHLLQTNIKTHANHALDVMSISNKEDITIIALRILNAADKQWGGFGNAPKFPQTFSLQMLLRHYYVHKDQAALQQVTLSIDKMIQGGIYDHLGGGFSRYSTDKQWQAPHFEKMLYDNALIISVLAEVYQITQNESYKKVIEQTLHFLSTELSNQEGAYYAALDADSEGVEGKYYTWEYQTLQSIIDEASFHKFCAYYQIEENGNWEHRNILWTQQNFLESETEPLKSIKKTLLAIRKKRIRPSLDHKIILCWNSLMCIALCKAAAALQDEGLVSKAVTMIQWIEENMYDEVEDFFVHVSTDNKKGTHAFLDDYASLIQAYIHLQEITGDIRYLYKAKRWTNYLQTHFIDEEQIFYYFTPAYQKDVVIRKKETYDGATPSGNAMMCYNLLYLSNMFGLTSWDEQAKKMLSSIHKPILQYPTSYGGWAQCLTLSILGFTECVSVGSNTIGKQLAVLKPFIPNRMTLFTKELDKSISLLHSKQTIDNQYYICNNGSCMPPISDWNDFLTIINQLNQ
jgi:uncharacterized protein YyaL (SSP411 family)